MPTQAQVASVDNSFARSRATFEAFCDRLRGPEALAMTHTAVERLLATEGREVLRQLLQDHVDLRGAYERAAPLPSVVGEDGVQRPHRREAKRDLRSIVGDVIVPRIGYSQRGATSRFPMDAGLNLPNDRYSMGVRHAVARAAASSSFEQAVADIEATTGTHVPKRQAEKLAQAAAVDFEAFYNERIVPRPTSPESLLVSLIRSGGQVDVLPAARGSCLALYSVLPLKSISAAAVQRRRGRSCGQPSAAVHRKSAERVPRRRSHRRWRSRSVGGRWSSRVPGDLVATGAWNALELQLRSSPDVRSAGRAGVLDLVASAGGGGAEPSTSTTLRLGPTLPGQQAASGKLLDERDPVS